MTHLGVQPSSRHPSQLQGTNVGLQPPGVAHGSQLMSPAKAAIAASRLGNLVSHVRDASPAAAQFSTPLHQHVPDQRSPARQPKLAVDPSQMPAVPPSNQPFSERLSQPRNRSEPNPNRPKPSVDLSQMPAAGSPSRKTGGVSEALHQHVPDQRSPAGQPKPSVDLSQMPAAGKKPGSEIYSKKRTAIPRPQIRKLNPPQEYQSVERGLQNAKHFNPKRSALTEGLGPCVGVLLVSTTESDLVHLDNDSMVPTGADTKLVGQRLAREIRTPQSMEQTKGRYAATQNPGDQKEIEAIDQLLSKCDEVKQRSMRSISARLASFKENPVTAVVAGGNDESGALTLKHISSELTNRGIKVHEFLTYGRGDAVAICHDCDRGNNTAYVALGVGEDILPNGKIEL